MDDLSDEIQALPRPFLENQGPQTLQDIGFHVKVPQGMMHKFVTLSSLEECQSGKQEGILDGTLIPYAAAEQKNDYVDARKRSVNDDSLMPEGLVKKVDPKALRGKLPGCCDKSYYAPGVKRAFRSKKEAFLWPFLPINEPQTLEDIGFERPIEKRTVDDDSWMPEGWVKKVNQRPARGKFPGYEDKSYYAPGVKRAFRSKKAALKYIIELGSSSKDTVAECGNSSKGPG